MKKINIYHSSWRMLSLDLACLSLVAGSVFMPEHTMDVFQFIIAWISIVFFCLGGLYMRYATMKERLTGKPFLTITDKDMISESVKQTVIRFADVESFEVAKMRNQQFVDVHYLNYLCTHKNGRET